MQQMQSLCHLMKLSVKIRIVILLCVTCAAISLMKITYDQIVDNDYDYFTQDLNDFDLLKEHLRMPDNLKGRKLGFDQVYEPRKVKLLTKKTTIKTNKTKVIVVWTPWNNLKKTINYYFPRPGRSLFTKYNCPVDACVITYERKEFPKADVVLFHLIDTYPNDIPPSRPPNQIWVVYNLEGPWLVNRDVPQPHRFDNLFNLTMSYREDSDILAKYGFIEAINESLSDSRLDDAYKKKVRSVVWFVSDCNTDSKREDYAKELQKYIDVDVYGLCGDKKCFPSQSAVCYEETFAKYKYYLSFENSICKDYVTEKFFNVFNYDIIPVVFGGSAYSTIAPNGTYIDAMHYPNPKDLAEVLQRIGDDPKAYKGMLRRKSSFRSYLYPWMCNFCEKLHEPVKHPPLRDVKEWWIKEASCRRWNKTAGYFKLN